MKLRRDTDSQDLHDEVKKYFTLENFRVDKFRNMKSQTRRIRTCYLEQLRLKFFSRQKRSQVMENDVGKGLKYNNFHSFR